MTQDIPLAIALFGPVVVLTFLRVNAAVVFLSLCLGQVLVRYVGADTLSGLTALLPHTSDLSKSMLQLTFLYAPAVATTIIMIGSVRGGLRRIFNLFPALGVGLLGTLIGVPLFTPGLRFAIERGPFWVQLSRAQALVVGIAALVSLVLLWSQRGSVKVVERRGSRHRG